MVGARVYGLYFMEIRGLEARAPIMGEVPVSS